MTIVAAGPQLATAMGSVSELEKKGINAEVIYMPTIKPFDHDTILKSITKTGKYLVIEEHSQFGGIADEVLRVVKDLENVKSKFINIPDKILHGYGNYNDHCTVVGLTSKNLVDSVQTIIG